MIELGIGEQKLKNASKGCNNESIIAKKVFMGDDSVVEAVKVGSIVMQVDLKGVQKPLTIKNVLYVLKLQANLLSIRKMVANK